MLELLARPVRRLARRVFLTGLRATLRAAFRRLLDNDAAAAAQAEGDLIWVELWWMQRSLYQLHASHEYIFAGSSGLLECGHHAKTRGELLGEWQQEQDRRGRGIELANA